MCLLRNKERDVNVNVHLLFKYIIIVITYMYLNLATKPHEICLQVDQISFTTCQISVLTSRTLGAIDYKLFSQLNDPYHTIKSKKNVQH